MGTIHERFKRRQQVFHQLDSQGPTVVGDRHRQLADKLRQLGKSNADRIVKLHEGLERAIGLPFAERHREMERLAVEARALGLKGRYALLCNRTQCLSDGAVWYNRGSYAFYCEDCAHMLNDANRNDPFCKDEPLCREVTKEEAETLHVSP